MKITRRSLISGNINEMELDITYEQLEQYHNGGLAQVVFPNLSADEREFFITGVTAKEWNDTFGEDE